MARGKLDRLVRRHHQECRRTLCLFWLAMWRQVRASLLAAAVLVAAISGCTGDEDPESSAPTSSPNIDSLAGCLHDRGWDIEVTWDDGIHYSIPAEQRDRFRKDLDECKLTAGYPKEALPMTEERAKKFYDKWLGIAECVRDRGFEVDEPPTEQAFVEALVSHEFIWDPMTHVPAAQWDGMARACDYDGTEN